MPLLYLLSPVLVRPLLTYSPSKQCYPLYPILYILARIIFRLTCDHISPLPEAPTGFNCPQEKVSRATGLLDLTSAICPSSVPPPFLQNITCNLFHLLSPFWVELVLSSSHPSRIWDLALQLFTYISVSLTKLRAPWELDYCIIHLCILSTKHKGDSSSMFVGCMNSVTSITLSQSSNPPAKIILTAMKIQNLIYANKKGKGRSDEVRFGLK